MLLNHVCSSIQSDSSLSVSRSVEGYNDHIANEHFNCSIDESNLMLFILNLSYNTVAITF